jgi:hypothetical protein
MSKLTDTFAAVEGTVDYIRASTSAPADDGWMRCDGLVDDPRLLVDLVATTGRGRGTDEPQVAASLFVQGYAFRVPSVAVAAHALGLPRPSLALDATAFRIARHRPAGVAHLDPRPAPSGRAAVVDDVLGHLDAVIRATRAHVTVGERLLWGNAAASLAVVFRAVEGALADHDQRRAVRRSADAFFAADPRLRGVGAFEVVGEPPDDGWFWARTNCCLWYRTADEQPERGQSGNRMCDDCSLLDPAARVAGWRTQLATKASS